MSQLLPNRQHSASPGPGRLRVAAAAVVLAAVVSGCSTGGGGATASPSVSRYPISVVPDPLAAAGAGATATHPAKAAPKVVREPIVGKRLWVDPNLPAAAQVAVWRKVGDTADAAILNRISSQPSAIWLTSNTPGTFAQLKAVTHGAQAVNRLPTLVVYDMVNRDCSGFSHGGAVNGAAYESWIRKVAATIGTDRAIIILEPDALADAVQGCAAPQATERFALMAYAVKVFEAHPGISVYLDAGSPGFPTSRTQLANALIRSDVKAAQGFALNVSNFYQTNTVVSYGASLSAAVGGKHFVIDTSRNGAGPLPTNSNYRGPVWCNPPGRKLGSPPTTITHVTGVDALLWIKTPGASDGTCGVNDPPAGRWWLTYAMDLASS